MRLITRGSNETYVVELLPAEYEAALALWPPPPPSEPLDEAVIDVWQQVFIKEISRLSLPTYARNALYRSLTVGNPFWGAETGRIEDQALVVYGLPTWGEWCDQILNDDLMAHLGRLRNFGHASYGKLKNAIRAQRLRGDSA